LHALADVIAGIGYGYEAIGLVAELSPRELDWLRQEFLRRAEVCAEAALELAGRLRRCAAGRNDERV
jgi:hypothetical protein